MANEITVHVGLTRNGLGVNHAPEQYNVTQATKARSGGTYAVGTATHTAITLNADVVTAGFAMVWNVSTETASVLQLGLDNSGTFLPFLSLKYNERYPVRFATTGIYAKATGAAGRLAADILAE